MTRFFKNLIFIASLAIITGCATSKVREEKLQSLKDNQVSLEGLNYGDLINLDKKQYLININSYNTGEVFKKKVGLIFITEELKQRKVSLNTIYLRHWTRKELNRRGYFIDRVSNEVPVVILVEYGLAPAANKEYENNFEALLFKKILKIRAIDYLAFKKSKKVLVYWSAEISSIGPSSDVGSALPILGSFLGEALEGNINNKKLIIPRNDPRLDLTKDIPTAISVDDFKPTVEELEFFN